MEAQLPGLEEEVDRDLDRPSFSFTRVENELLPLLLRPLLLLLLLELDLEEDEAQLPLLLPPLLLLLLLLLPQPPLTTT